MELYSLEFILFVAVLFVLYYTVCKKVQWILLLIGSLAFYALYGIPNMAFIGITSVSAWLGALVIDRFNTQYKQERKAAGKDRAKKKAVKKVCMHRKRLVLLAICLLNFGILFYFKYWNWILECITRAGHATVNQFTVYTAADLALPLGISFYTFQTVSYFIDVYNGKEAVEKNYFKLLLFTSYFPQLFQGPINRFHEIAPQFFERHSFSPEQTKRALLLFLFGMLKKYAVANLLAAPLAAIFDNGVDDLSGPVIVFGILCYSAQQYCDFSGGIDMVLAVSGLFGIRMMQNFRQPYFAVTLGDFWRRWHISLGAWMRDYIFYPFALTKMMQKLGKWSGKHLGKHFGRVLPASIANIVVFFVVGAWHGSQLHFIIWGLYNGIVIALSDILSPVFAKWTNALHINVKSAGFHVFRIIRTFIIVNIGWYFDRIVRFRDSMTCLRNTFVHPDWDLNTLGDVIGSQFFLKNGCTLPIIILALIIVFWHSVLREREVDVYGLLHQKKIGFRFFCYFVLLLLIVISFAFSNTGGGFLYANF